MDGNNFYDDFNLIQNFVDSLKTLQTTDLMEDLLNGCPNHSDFTTIPKINHVILLSNNFITINALNLIKHFSNLNNNFSMVLWVDGDSKNDSEEEKYLLSEARKNGFKVMDYKYPLAKIKEMGLEDGNPKELTILPYVFKILLLQRKFSQVTNILRLIVLYLFGGISADLDNPIQKPIDDLFLNTKTGLKLNKKSINPYINVDQDIENNYSCTNAIASSGQHPSILDILKSCINKSLKKYHDIFSGRNYSYLSSGNNVLLDFNYVDNYAKYNYSLATESICKTFEYYKIDCESTINEAEEIPQGYFIDTGSLGICWENNKKPQECRSNELAIDEGITAIVNELYYEPRVLRLDLTELSHAWSTIQFTAEFYRVILRKIVSDERLKQQIQRIEKIDYPDQFNFSVVLLHNDAIVDRSKLTENLIFLQSLKSSQETTKYSVIAYFVQNNKIIEKEIQLVGVNIDNLHFPTGSIKENIVLFENNKTLIKTIAMLCGCPEKAYFYTPELINLVFGLASPFTNLAITQYFLNPGVFDFSSAIELLKTKKIAAEYEMDYEQIQMKYYPYGQVVDQKTFENHKRLLINLKNRNNL